MTQFAKLERVGSVKEVLRSEARDFTPWLATEGGLALLSEALGYPSDWLELIDTEVSTGDFRADIVCRETVPDGRTIVIENQYGATDHSHLGQILTYAAGQKAGIVIWVCETVRQEHAAAIDYLNELTDESFDGFAVEIEFLRIAGSDPAPRFNIISKPNNWVRNQKAQRKLAGGKISPFRHLQREYWEAVEYLLSETDGPVTPVAPMPQSWVVHSIGKSGVSLNFSMNTFKNFIRAEVYLGGPRAKERFSDLLAQRESIQANCTLELHWEEMSDKNDSRIAVYLENCDPKDKSKWPQQHKWLVEAGSNLHHAFHEPVAALI